MTHAQRHYCMSRIRSRDTKPELVVRSCLHRLGYRFRVHDQRLPGHPDVVLPRYRTVVLVHGCFWHRHPGCTYAYQPATRREFWEAKFKQNVERDRLVEEQLRAQGWQVVTVWECMTKDAGALREVLQELMPRRPEQKETGGDG